MSATMATQRGQVQLEHSDMRLALNMAKMAKEGFSRATIQETQQLIKKPLVQVREEKKQGVVFPSHNNVTAAIDRHPAMIQEHQIDSCLPCPNDTAKNPRTRWRCKGRSAPPPRLAPPRPKTPLAPPDASERTQSSETEGGPPGYVYIHTPLPSARFFTLGPHAYERMRDKDFIPDLLTDEGPSTG